LRHHVACRKPKDNRDSNKSGQSEHFCLRSFDRPLRRCLAPVLTRSAPPTRSFKSERLACAGKDLIKHIQLVAGAKISTGGNCAPEGSGRRSRLKFLCFRHLSQPLVQPHCGPGMQRKQRRAT
jgi:hypothetical protein